MALIQQVPPDYDNALLAVQQTVSELEQLLAKIDAVSLPDEKARQIKDELQVALISERLALGALTRLQAHRGREQDDSLAVVYLRNSRRAKGRALSLFIEMKQRKATTQRLP